MLSQAVYWSQRTKDPNGWFYKSAIEWQEETGLSRREQETVRKILRKSGIWSEKRRGVPATLNFKVEFSAIFSRLHEIANLKETPNQIHPERETSFDKPANLLFTETTTEITTPSSSKDDAPKVPLLIVECYKPFIAIWSKKYPLLLTMPKDGAKVKFIIRGVIDILKSEDWEVSVEQACNFWTKFVDNLHRTWGHNKDLSTIDSKLKSLFLEMKGTGSRDAGRRDSWESEFAEKANY